MAPQAMSRVSPTSLNSVKVLCEHQNTTVVIFSGSAKVRFDLHLLVPRRRSR